MLLLRLERRVCCVTVGWFWQVGSDRNVVELQLRVLDAKKRRDTHKENEAIQFNYVLNKDNPEETAKQMVAALVLNGSNWIGLPFI